MENLDTTMKVFNGVKSLLTLLPSISYGTNAIEYLAIEQYGSGQVGFNLLKTEFDKLDLSKPSEFLDLEKQIQKQKKELKDLEKKHTNLSAIIGENTEGKEGSIASQILISLKNEIDQLIEKRNELLDDISIKEDKEEKRNANHTAKIISQEADYKKKTIELEEQFKKKEEKLKSNFDIAKAEIELNTNTATDIANNKIKVAESNANVKVKLINQFKDFLEETNKNMTLYSCVILGILILAIGAIWFSIPNLLKIFDSYDTFIKIQGTKITNLQIINYAFGLLIVKLPWALCLSAVLTGMYSLLKGLILTYEKINQDKRNMSAIYAISGNVAQALNEYGLTLADEDIEDEETGQTFTSIRVSKKELEQKKENIRWNQIMKYFEGMQQNKVELIDSEDESKLKLVTGLLNKMIEKIPKT